VFRERAFLLHEPAAHFPLHVAAFAGDLGLLAADRAALGAADDLQNSAIIWAAEAGQLESVRTLAGLGVNLDAKGMSGNTALHRAVKRSHPAVVQLLLELGAKPNVWNDRQQTPLHQAAFNQHAACVHALLAAGADPAVIDGRGKSPAEDTADEAIAAELRKAEAVQAPGKL